MTQRSPIPRVSQGLLVTVIKAHTSHNAHNALQENQQSIKSLKPFPHVYRSNWALWIRATAENAVAMQKAICTFVSRMEKTV